MFVEETVALLAKDDEYSVNVKMICLLYCWLNVMAFKMLNIQLNIQLFNKQNVNNELNYEIYKQFEMLN